MRKVYSPVNKQHLGSHTQTARVINLEDLPSDELATSLKSLRMHARHLCSQKSFSFVCNSTLNLSKLIMFSDQHFFFFYFKRCYNVLNVSGKSMVAISVFHHGTIISCSLLQLNINSLINDKFNMPQCLPTCDEPLRKGCVHYYIIAKIWLRALLLTLIDFLLEHIWIHNNGMLVPVRTSFGLSAWR